MRCPHCKSERVEFTGKISVKIIGDGWPLALVAAAVIAWGGKLLGFSYPATSFFALIATLPAFFFFSTIHECDVCGSEFQAGEVSDASPLDKTLGK